VLALDNASLLVTGGTGSFGRAFCRHVLRHYKPDRLIVYSRDELKQSEMMADPELQSPAIRYFLGDVRDRDRLTRAMSGCDIAVHAAALKQVPAAEYNPHEFIKTNIQGATNVVDAALANNVSRVVALSTDKAVNPINLYGATKLCSDKIFSAANSYRGRGDTAFSVVRYGNVIASRGSVIPLFLKQRASGRLTLTDPSMTRFFLSLEEGVRFVLLGLTEMIGGEIFVPKIPSCSIGELATAIAPDAEHVVTGKRPGEKDHEILIPQDEAHLCVEYPGHYIIEPTLPFWEKAARPEGGKPVASGFAYRSDTNPHRFTASDLARVCNEAADYLGIPELTSATLP
jgi:UDP-N-acetylglucosamine 4,6-dehydratase